MNFLLFIILLLFVGCSSDKHQRGPVPIIFDTDMGPDYDDVGAIAVLSALTANNECEILACCASSGYVSIAPTIKLLNNYFGNSDVPVGKAVNEAPDITHHNHWNDSLISKFDTKNIVCTINYPSSVKVYRKTLSEQADKSTIILTVGFLSNLDQLLRSGPDEYSELSGYELVKKKVAKLVSMAGTFPEGKEYNVLTHAEASYNVFNNWPTPILFCGFEIGLSILTGNKVAKEGSKNNLVAWAYKYNLETYAGTRSENRPSWDPIAVLCAIRNPEEYFYVNGPGKMLVDENGHNSWDPEINAGHFFISHKYPYKVIASIIEQLMLYEPAD